MIFSWRSNIVAENSLCQNNYCNLTCCCRFCVNDSCTHSLDNHFKEKPPTRQLMKERINRILRTFSLYRPVDNETICRISKKIISEISQSMGLLMECFTELPVLYSGSGSMLFLSLQYITNFAVTSRKDDCQRNRGTYHKQLGVCVLNRGNHPCKGLSCIFKYLNPRISNYIAATGHAFSSVSLVILLVTYFWFRELQTLPGINITRMTMVLLLAFVL